MEIKIAIDKESASEIVQNIALLNGWNDLTDEEAAAKITDKLAGVLRDWAFQGNTVRVRENAEKPVKEALSEVITAA